MIVAGNWKMNTTPLDASLLANDIAAATDVAGVTRVICPPFVCLESVARALADTDVAVGVQNIHAQPFGAYTGEISAPMVNMLATWAIIGHSERRRDQAETDEQIGRKLLRCAEFGLRPILCVGEQLEDREAGRAEETVRGQLERTMSMVEGAAARVPDDLVIAYEPVWAIGTGRTARGSDAAQMAQVIRRELAEHGVPNGGDERARPVRRQRHQFGDRGVPGRAGHRRRARRRRQPEGRRDGRHRCPRRTDCGRPIRSQILTTSAMTDSTRPRPLVLVVIDGFGIGKRPGDDAIAQAAMPRWRALLAEWPHAQLEASAEAVGLPPGPDGQQRGRPSQSRRRTAGGPGPAAHRRRDRRRLLRCRTPAFWSSAVDARRSRALGCT